MKNQMDIMLENEWVVMDVVDNGYSYGNVFGFCESFDGEMYLIFGGPNNWAITSSTALRNDNGRTYISPVGLPFYSDTNTIHRLVEKFNTMCESTKMPITSKRISPIKYVTMRYGILTMEYNENGEWLVDIFKAEFYNDVVELISNYHEWEIQPKISTDKLHISVVGHTADKVVVGIVQKLGSAMTLLMFHDVRIDGTLNSIVSGVLYSGDLENDIRRYNSLAEEDGNELDKIITAVSPEGEINLD